MLDSASEKYASHRDLWLCLARAFAPPTADSFFQAFTQDLPHDLAAIADELGISLTSEVEGFAAAAQLLPDALELQRIYAALFVIPPAPVFMNTAIYLDGAFLGPSEIDINGWYSRHHYQRHPEFHDLNDHAAAQFEFLALLYERALKAAVAHDHMEAVAYASEAERFLNAFPKRWIGPFLQAVEKTCAEHDLSTVYLHLGRIVWLAIDNALQDGSSRLQMESGLAFPEASSRGIGALTAEDLAEIALRLDAAGLDYGHIRALPEWREETFSARTTNRSR